MHSRRRKKGRTIGYMLGVLAGGILIVVITAYTIISLTAPPQPEHGDVSPPQDNTPFVGKKW